MAQIIVRNITQETVDSLKAIARQNHRSLEAEVRFLIEDAARRRLSREEFIAFANEVAQRNGPQTTDSVDLIRADRER